MALIFFVKFGFGPSSNWLDVGDDSDLGCPPLHFFLAETVKEVLIESLIYTLIDFISNLCNWNDLFG